MASARLGAKAASESTQQTQQDVLLAVDRAYFGVLRAQAVLKVAEETVKARQILADQVTTLEKNKLKSMLDVSFAEVNLAQAKLLLVQAQNDQKAADAELANALGLANPQPFDLNEEPMPDAPPADPTDLIARLSKAGRTLPVRDSVTRLLVRYARAERDLWMPTVSATGAAGLTPGLSSAAHRPLCGGWHQREYPDLQRLSVFRPPSGSKSPRPGGGPAHARPCRPHRARRAHRLAQCRTPPFSASTSPPSC